MEASEYLLSKCPVNFQNRVLYLAKTSMGNFFNLAIKKGSKLATSGFKFLVP